MFQPQTAISFIGILCDTDKTHDAGVKHGGGRILVWGCSSLSVTATLVSVYVKMGATKYGHGGGCKET